MATRLNPYINLDHEARQALEFYRDVFGGESTVMTFGDMGTEGPDAAKVMHGQLETPAGYTLMVSDRPEGMAGSVGSNISISLSGDDPDDLRGYFAKLADGGTVSVPLEKQMWGDEFGMCTDRFGVDWMVNVSEKAA
jgi:PhnB protein